MCTKYFVYSNPLLSSISQHDLGKATGLDNNICQKYVVLDKNLANHVTDLQKKTTEPKSEILHGIGVRMPLKETKRDRKKSPDWSKLTLI